MTNVPLPPAAAPISTPIPAPEPRPGWMRVGAFAAGVALIAAGVADAAFNPLAFITAEKLIGSGVLLIGMGATGRAKQ